MPLSKKVVNTLVKPLLPILTIDTIVYHGRLHPHCLLPWILIFMINYIFLFALLTKAITKNETNNSNINKRRELIMAVQ